MPFTASGYGPYLKVLGIGKGGGGGRAWISPSPPINDNVHNRGLLNQAGAAGGVFPSHPTPPPTKPGCDG